MKHAIGTRPTLNRKPRRLDDEELDSGDDMDRDDRAHSAEAGEEADVETAQTLVEESSFARRPLPQPSDGEVWRYTRPNDSKKTMLTAM